MNLNDPRPLKRLNLNLLYTLNVVLKAPTLTEAGRLMSLSQPAMSMALRQLRDHFSDELISYRGKRPKLTALGNALQPRIAQVLREAEDAFRLTLDFDPASARKTICLAAPEAIELMFLDRVVSNILRGGPLLDVRLASFDYSSVESMFEQGVDIALVPESMVDPKFESKPLFHHDLVGLIWDKHPSLGDKLTLQEYLAGRHVALLEDMERVEGLGSDLESILSQRHVVVRTGVYSMLPNLVIGTDLIATTSNWLAQYLASVLPVRPVTLPIKLSGAFITAQWERHRSSEPMLLWLLEIIGRRANLSAVNPQDNQ